MRSRELRIEVVGHRGSRGTHPENTLSSFREAVAAGAEAIELDLQLSQDDVPVVFHDPLLTGKLCRGPDGKKPRRPIPVLHLRAEEIRRFDCGRNFQIAFPRQVRREPAPVLLFDEFLEWARAEAKGIELFVELKIPGDKPRLVPSRQRFAEAVVERLDRYALSSRAIVQSFDFKILDAVKKASSGQRLSYLFWREPRFVELARRFEASCVTPHVGLLNPKRMAAAREAGLRVVPWTVNRIKDWRRCVRLGVDGIITDYPRRLRAFLDRAQGRKR